MLVDFTPLHRVSAALTHAGIRHALGGSGLLHSLGLIDQVRDWDITTEAPLEQVTQALAAIPWALSPCGDPPFASAFRLAVNAGGQPIDLMGRFAIHAETGICHIPTIVAGTWEGVPVGSPEVWAVAYRLMGRTPKADLLSQHVARHSAAPEAVAALLAQPLPDAVRAEVAGWGRRSVT